VRLLTQITDMQLKISSLTTQAVNEIGKALDKLLALIQ